MYRFDKNLSEIEKAIEKFSLLIRSVIRRTSPRIATGDLEDITQEVKLNIWKELIKSEKKIHNLASYITKVAYTTTCGMMRKLAKNITVSIEESETIQLMVENKTSTELDLPDRYLENEEVQILIKESVEQLINSRRQVVKLYLMGMDLEAISGYLDWSSDKVRNLLYRGLADLKAILKKRNLEYEN
jgi:RNA polymerase sigma factor (sigma-70 family)